MLTNKCSANTHMTLPGVGTTFTASGFIISSPLRVHAATVQLNVDRAVKFHIQMSESSCKDKAHDRYASAYLTRR
jgi:hypothetical protein